jgi:hypothetical protein
MLTHRADGARAQRVTCHPSKVGAVPPAVRPYARAERGQQRCAWRDGPVGWVPGIRCLVGRLAQTLVWGGGKGVAWGRGSLVDVRAAAIQRLDRANVDAARARPQQPTQLAQENAEDPESGFRVQVQGLPSEPLNPEARAPPHGKPYCASQYAPSDWDPWDRTHSRTSARARVGGMAGTGGHGGRCAQACGRAGRSGLVARPLALVCPPIGTPPHRHSRHPLCFCIVCPPPAHPPTGAQGGCVERLV